MEWKAGHTTGLEFVMKLQNQLKVCPERDHAMLLVLLKKTDLHKCIIM